jgi:hypothetical protein
MAKSISLAKQLTAQGSPAVLPSPDHIPADPSSARDLHKNAQILTKPRKRPANRRRIVRT